MDEASKTKAIVPTQPILFAEVAAAGYQPSSDIIFKEKRTRFLLAREKRVRFLSNLYIGSSPPFRFWLAQAERERFISNLIRNEKKYLIPIVLYVL